MAKVIPFPDRSGGESNLIQNEPFCFRRADWGVREPVQVNSQEAAAFEEKRAKALGQGRPITFAPHHLVLRGSLSQTTWALFRAREDESRMRRVYYLAGLMELAIKVPHHLLRTDLIRRVFEQIESLSTELGLRWRRGSEGFLLPLPPARYPLNRFPHALAQAPSLKKLLSSLNSETNIQFDLAGRLFVYYLPAAWV